MTTAQQVIFERPPEGMPRGRVPVPWWAIVALTAAIVVASAVFLIVRLLARSRVPKGGLGPLGAGDGGAANGSTPGAGVAGS